jgi:hypothetical protein
MQYDEKNLTKTQQKIAQKAIESVIETFRLEMPPKYTIKGLNPNEEVAKLEYQKLKKDEKEIRKIEKEIKLTQNYASNFIKVIFDFDKALKILMYSTDIMKTKKFFLPLRIWSGVLDYPITGPIIFGRVCKKERHKGGKYYFAPLKTLKHELFDRFERLEEKVPEFFPYGIIEPDLFQDLMKYFKYSPETRKDLKQRVRAEDRTKLLVFKLNEQKELIKKMTKIPHFGATEYMLTKFVSEIDVSTICFPYKDFTYFHIELFGFSSKKHFRAVYSFLNVLEELKEMGL